jgi:hypothetical protein
MESVMFRDRVIVIMAGKEEDVKSWTFKRLI